jgi:hypothetical protein
VLVIGGAQAGKEDLNNSSGKDISGNANNVSCSSNS